MNGLRDRRPAAVLDAGAVTSAVRQRRLSVGRQESAILLGDGLIPIVFGQLQKNAVL